MPDTDKHSFNTLYTQYYRKAFLFTKSFVHDEVIAEDIASDGLIKLWEKLQEKDIEHPAALLLTILKNKALDYLKHEAIRDEVLHTLSDLSQQELEIRISTLQVCDPEEIFSEEVRQIIQKTLDALPSQTRKAFIMSRFQHKTNQEIAAELGISIKGVEYHITKALKVLRINLKDYLPLFNFLFL